MGRKEKRSTHCQEIQSKATSKYKQHGNKWAAWSQQFMGCRCDCAGERNTHTHAHTLAHTSMGDADVSMLQVAFIVTQSTRPHNLFRAQEIETWNIRNTQMHTCTQRCQELKHTDQQLLLKLTWEV